MTRTEKEKEYLARLEKALNAKGLAPETVQEVLRDQEEHFAAAHEAGKTLAETARGLGSPEALAEGYAAMAQLDRARTPKASWSERSSALWVAVKALLILAPLNFFVFLGPVLLIGLGLFLGWIAASVLASFGIGATVYWFLHLPFAGAPWTDIASGLCLGLGLFTAALAFIMFMFWLTHQLARLAVRYGQWNLKFLSEGARV